MPTHQRGKTAKSGTKIAAFSCAIMTIDRPKNYIYRLISRLPKRQPVRLIVGSPSYAYLQRYRKRKNIEIIRVSLTEWDRFKDYVVKHRASWNYWRSLRYGALSNCAKGLILLEDDVLPMRGWQRRLHSAVREIEQEYDQYILALYTAFTGLQKPDAPGASFTRYPVRRFFGTQAMYYPSTVRMAFAEYLLHHGVERFRTHYDLLLSDYLTITGIPLFVTTPSLFQHIGAVSTGLAPFFHSSPESLKR